MTMTELQWFSQFGVAGLFAGVVLLIYRADRRESERRLTGLANDFKVLAGEFRQTIEKNTEVLTRLTEKITSEKRPDLL